MLIIRDASGSTLLLQRPASGIWGGLWSFPEQDPESDPNEACEQLTGRWPTKRIEGSRFRHTFSHYHLDILPVWLTIDSPTDVVSENSQSVWYKPGKMQLGIAAPVAKLLQSEPHESGEN